MRTYRQNITTLIGILCLCTVASPLSAQVHYDRLPGTLGSLVGYSPTGVTALPPTGSATRPPLGVSGSQTVTEIAKRRPELVRTNLGAGGDDLRSLLTLPSVAVPNTITPRPLSFSPLFRDSRDRPGSLHLDLSNIPKVGRPHLWAGVGTVLGGLANMNLSRYRLSEFKLRFNPWWSEKIALRDQGADMVQHFILGYGLTRYFLDNGSGVLDAGLSAFAYEFVLGEVFESFPQAGGISVRDVAIDIIAVAVGMIDHDGTSRLRFWAGSQTTIRPSAPNEFDPYRIGLGVAIGRVGGLDLVCTIENWKDQHPRHPDLDDPGETAPSYSLERM